MIDFKNIAYLAAGNDRQKRAYRELNELSIFEKLKPYDPILTGTIPIDIDISNSDLDIICYTSNLQEFANSLKYLFGNQPNFSITFKQFEDLPCVISTFKTKSFEIEIFGQNIPTEMQNAYRHMLIEYKILNSRDARFKAQIRKLKTEGLKTEPAFAKLLELKGDPYKALLNFEI